MWGGRSGDWDAGFKTLRSFFSDLTLFVSNQEEGVTGFFLFWFIFSFSSSFVAHWDVARCRTSQLVVGLSDK